MNVSMNRMTMNMRRYEYLRREIISAPISTISSSKPIFTCSKSMETLEQSVNFVQTQQ